MRYAARRLLHGLLLLAVLSAVSFLFADLAPSDFYSDLGLDPRLSPQSIEGMRTQADLRRPLAVRYASWAASMARGDFGYSLAYRSPVALLLRERIPATLVLTGVSTLAAWLLAFPLGIWIAAHRGTWRDDAGRIAVAVL